MTHCVRGFTPISPWSFLSCYPCSAASLAFWVVLSTETPNYCRATTLSVLLRMVFAHTYTLLVSLPLLGLCSGVTALVQFHTTSYTIPMLPQFWFICIHCCYHPSILVGHSSISSPPCLLNISVNNLSSIYHLLISVICMLVLIIYLLVSILFLWSINHLPAYRKTVRSTKTRSCSVNLCMPVT